MNKGQTMTELLTAAQMRAIEAAAIASGEVTGLELMERAGRGVVEAIFEEWPELAKTSHRAVVLCGPGNNGGDGFVVARLLKDWGWEVEVFLYGTPEGMPADARVNYERWVELGEVGALKEGSDETAPGWEVGLEIADLVIDALFGIGISRPLPKLPPVRRFMARAFGNNYLGTIDDWLPAVVSIDIPSGVCANSGKHLRTMPVVRNRDCFANLTVTFHSPKFGHCIGEGPSACGKLVVKDIGLSWPVESWVTLISSPENTAKIAGHKYSHGHALILSGPPGHGGAARLAARGALRIGAGLVTVACPPEAMPENAARLDAVMLRVVADGAGLGEVLADKRINALCLGPGLGLDAQAVGFVAAALDGRGTTRPTVLDADALTILSQNADLFTALHPNCILTPHAGEFARMFPDIAAKLDAPATKGPAYSKVDATRDAAKRAGCVVLFKGPDTAIADPSGRCSINSAHYDRAAPWLATAGSGDVLAGFITGLLARGFAPMQAAETAAWLHVECARSFGPGLIAEDLPEELPKVFRALGL